MRFEETGLRAKPVLKGIITFPESFTPDLDWYTTYVFKVTDFMGELIECNEGTLEYLMIRSLKPTLGRGPPCRVVIGG